MGCPYIRIEPKEGHCWLASCGIPLPKYRRKWCCDDHGLWYHQNHSWTLARSKTLSRDKRCVKCGSIRDLEVNHIEPRRGRGYSNGCHNHQDNLETLCHDCHVKVTCEQQGWIPACEREARKQELKLEALVVSQSKFVTTWPGLDVRAYEKSQA